MQEDRNRNAAPFIIFPIVTTRVYASSERKVCRYNVGRISEEVCMAHKLETAHISFGLVTIPVGIYSWGFILPSMSRIFIFTSCMPPNGRGDEENS